MSSAPVFTITYWGVTGTFASPLRPPQVTEKIVESIARLVELDRLAGLRPGPELRAQIERLLEADLPFPTRSSYGGNTTCVEVRTADELFILDCGSGFRELGYSLERRWAKEGAQARRRAHVLMTHAHMDHTFATPFFSPYYNRENSFTIWGPQLTLDSLAAVLDPRSSLSQVYFPPTYDEMKALHDFRPLTPGADFCLGRTRITTFGLNHPGGAMAYRFDCDGRSFVFATDHEHMEVPDRRLAEFARGADLFYTEGQYTAAEYAGEMGIGSDRPASRKGWGHSPIEACVATAVEAGVRALHVGHREPRRTDDEIAKLEASLRRLYAAELAHRGIQPLGGEPIVPYEGLTLEI